MRYTNLFTKTSKEKPKGEDSRNAELLIRGGFVAKQMAGVYNYLPLGLRVLRKIQNIVREEMEALGANEVLMPALTQAENYEQTGRDNMDILFATEGHGEHKMFLNPTHEEVITPLLKKHVFSYRDLPRAVFQIQDKFRNEPRAKSGLLRGREFSMKDLYSFHTDLKDLDDYYEKATRAYFKIYERLGLGDLTVLTYASGGVFTKYSHEFQTLSEVGEDTIYLCEKCKLAVNEEIIADQNVCPNCGNTDLRAKKAIEVGNIFKLGDKFSKAFGFVYSDEDGQERTVQMGCYGIGPSRIMGVLAEIFNDERGLIWPENIAPYKVHLLFLGKEEEIKEKADKLYEDLLGKGVEVLYDDREAGAGEKLADADLIGCPLRVVLSKKSLEKGGVEVKKRSEEKTEVVSLEEFLNRL